MKALHLVISYEDGQQWRIYIPGCIRRELDRGLKAEFMQMLNSGIPWLK